MRFVSKFSVFSDNYGKKGVNTMDDMILTLKQIGLPDDECNRLREYYRDDLDGLAMYVLYMRAMFDDFRDYAG